MADRYAYMLDVVYPEGSDAYGWEPEGWDPEWNGDPDADLDFRWPRVHPYLSRSGAVARAKMLESYGAKVTIRRSNPITWPDE